MKEENKLVSEEIREKITNPSKDSNSAVDLPQFFEVHEIKPEPACEPEPILSPVELSIHEEKEILEEALEETPNVSQGGGEQLDRNEIEKLVSDKDPSITFQKPEIIRNPKIWNIFDLVYYKSFRQLFASCTLCNSLINFKMRQASSILGRHKCNSIKNQETKRLNNISPTPSAPTQRTEINGKRTASTRLQSKAASLTSSGKLPIPLNLTRMTLIPLLPKLIPENVTADLLEAQVKFLSNGMLSTNTLSDPNFLELAQQILNIGAKFGKHQVVDFLRQSMVEEYVLDKILISKEKLKKNLSGFSISHCVWKSKNKEFVTVYGYYLTDEFCFKTVVLGTKMCTGLPSVLQIVECLVAEFRSQSDNDNPDIKIKCIGTNLIKDESHKSIKNHPCVIRLITNIIHFVYLESKEFLKTLLHSFNDIHSLNEFPATTRDIMLHIIFLHEFIIKEDSERNSELSKNLKTLKVLFEPLVDAIGRLGHEKKASASEIFLWFQKFIKYYSKEFEVESEEEEKRDLNIVRIKLLELIKQQYLKHIKDFYGVAVFLDPNFKSLKFLNFNERGVLLDLVKAALKKLTVNINPPNPKKIKLDTFLEFMDISMGDEEDHINSEIQRYLGLNLESTVHVMDFWNTSDDLPNLKKLARNIMHVPACSFFSGCCFLSVREDEKCNLRAEEIESYTFLNHNVKL